MHNAAGADQRGCNSPPADGRRDRSASSRATGRHRRCARRRHARQQSRPRPRAGGPDQRHVRSSTAAKNPSVPWRRRGQTHHAALGRAPPRRGGRQLLNAKSAMLGQKALHLILILRSQQRAGRIDQPPALAQEARGIMQDRGLLFHKVGEIGLGESRSRASGLRRQVPVPVQGASTSTRSQVSRRRFAHFCRPASADAARHYARPPGAAAAPPLQPRRRGIGRQDMAA